MKGCVPKFGKAQGGAGGVPPIPPWFAQLPKNWDAPSMKEDVANYKKNVIIKTDFDIRRDSCWLRL
jgi:hypothetical protein